MPCDAFPRKLNSSSCLLSEDPIIQASCWISLTCSTLSGLCGLLILLVLKNGQAVSGLSPTPTRLFTCLAIADIGVGVGSILSMTYSENFECDEYKFHEVMCILQSFISSVFALSSFFWTASLGVYFGAKIFTNQNSQQDPAQHTVTLTTLLCFGCPVIISSIALSVKGLGSDVYTTTAGWCWISGCLHKDQGFALRLWTGKFWEIIIYVGMVVGTFLANLKLKDNMASKVRMQNGGNIFEEFDKASRSRVPVVVYHSMSSSVEDSVQSRGTQNEISGLHNDLLPIPQRPESRRIITQEEKMFLFMPYMLALARIAGTVRFILWIIINFSDVNHDQLQPVDYYCLSTDSVIRWNHFLMPLQAFGDCSQAMINFILLMCYSKNARNFLYRRIIG